MSSSEEYLENLLQSMMNGEVASPSEDDLNDPERQKSAIAMLSGEEPEPIMPVESASEKPSASAGMEDMEAMLAEMVANLDESEDGMMPDADITDDMAENDESGVDSVSSMEEELSLEETGAEELSLDDLGINDLALDDLEIDDLAEDSIADLEESEAEELSLDDLGLDDMVLEEPAMDDIALEEPDMDEIPSEENDIDSIAGEELSLDDLGLDDLSEVGIADLEETGMDEMTKVSIADLEEAGTDDMAGEEMSEVSIADLEESGEEELSLDNLEIEDMALEESEADNITDDFALEEDGMGDDFAEINDLLDQSEQGEEIDDEMLALLESVSDSAEGDETGSGSDEFAFQEGDGAAAGSSDESTASEEAEEESSKKKKKKRKGWGKKKKGGDLQDDLSETAENDGIETGEKEEKEKKPGIFARFLAFLTETDEEEEDAEKSTDENTEILEELSQEDKKAQKEKKKKEKKEKKPKKGKKGSGDEEGEDGEKAAKKKKPKKEKKEKVVDEEELKADTGKKLSKKKVMPIILFAATIMAGILILSSVVPNYLEKRDAQIAYDMGNYSQAYDLLYGKDLSEEEEAILAKSTIILKMERKLDSYHNYWKIGDDEVKKLNILIQGAALYFELLPEAEEYNVTDKITSIYQEILAVIYSDYGLIETDVMLILDSEDDIAYTKMLNSIVYGINYDEGIGGEEESGSTIEDVLPEEQEILDGLQNNG